MDASNINSVQLEHLKPVAIPASFEDVAEMLFEEVCCGSRPLWNSMNGEEFIKDPENRKEFYRLVHQGMWGAQQRYLSRLQIGNPLQPAERALYTKAMDSIAWQMLQKQLCFARRIYREKSQPNLNHSNLKSVITTCNFLKQQEPDSMPLISDLTSFVQVGDILLINPNKGVTIIEVKEGEKNRELMELVDFYQSSQCEHFRSNIQENQSTSTFKQFERMLRQSDRMKFVTQVIKKGNGVDPDSGQEIRIPEPYIHIQEWSNELNLVLDRALDKGWAIDAIDNSLFIGCYSGNMRQAAPFAFSAWLNQFSGGEHTPVARLIDAMTHPLAMPIFLAPISKERMMDIIFGRLHVCMGIALPGLIQECSQYEIEARTPNKSERRSISQRGLAPIRFNGHPLILERKGKSMIMSDGIFLRSFFHFQRPAAMINAMFENF